VELEIAAIRWVVWRTSLHAYLSSRKRKLSWTKAYLSLSEFWGDRMNTAYRLGMTAQELRSNRGHFGIVRPPLCCIWRAIQGGRNRKRFG